jgi:hypothetical protein
MSLIQNYEKYQKEMFDTLKRKNADYAGPKGEYTNFTTCEYLGICPTMEGLMVRITDKLTRSSNLIKRDPQVVNESLKDTLLDMANYCMIAASYSEDLGLISDQVELIGGKNER